ncbi:MAG: aminoglycoside phosphotransferase family protein [Sedimentisphaerales bacterium]|nr:aminoglycoside phosphotransferase family protein [Sedimentisphaerales bacterium]
MEISLERVCRHFELPGEIIALEPFGGGHINDTYRVRCQCDGDEQYVILQRINHAVFTRPDEVMENITRVTDHIRAKLTAAGASDISRRVLQFHLTRDGKSYYRDEAGGYWRVCDFIAGASTWDVPKTQEQLYQAARAFGVFGAMLADLPGPPLFETIPQFHDGRNRYRQFTDALAKDAKKRAASVKEEIDFLQTRAEMLLLPGKLIESGQIPLRITHNDTKVNNVMLDDATGEGLCVIDLDTVMSGLTFYDFGDLVRTTVAGCEEDETDLSKVQADPQRFQAVLEGYLSSAGAFLTPIEREHLVFGGKYMSMIMGTRFLTDYLNGDVYYKIHRPGHNLDRCRVQFQIVASLERQSDALEAMVRRMA